MSVWQTPAHNNPPLVGAQGELLRARISVSWRDLEDLLESLACAPFPINPEIRHGSPLTYVEFPVYSSQVDEVRRLVAADAVDFELHDEWSELTSTAFA